MNIPSAKYLKNKARNRLESGKEPQQVILWYAGISAVMAFVVTAVRYALASEITKTGGLSNIGIRSVLSTADNVLPILQTVLMMCLDLGYVAAMLRISRRQYASAMTLKAGVERFWPLIRCKLLLFFTYLGAGLVLSYLASILFTISPFAAKFAQTVNAVTGGDMRNLEALAADPMFVASLYDSMLPAIIIWAVLYIPVTVVLSYHYRLADYILVDQPQSGALYALRQSRILMRGNIWRMMKVDLSFWWFYLLKSLATVILYADLILPLFGFTLPGSEVVVLLGTALVYLAADFALNYYFRNRVAVTCALAYTSLVPKEKNDGVVLGNIFQMAAQNPEAENE